LGEFLDNNYVFEKIGSRKDFKNKRELQTPSQSFLLPFRQRAAKAVDYPRAPIALSRFNTGTELHAHVTLVEAGWLVTLEAIELVTGFTYMSAPVVSVRYRLLGALPIWVNLKRD